MKNPLLMMAPVFLASAVTQADTIRVLVFHDSDLAPVLNDLRTHSNVDITFIDIAEGRHMSDRLTRRLDADIQAAGVQNEAEAQTVIENSFNRYAQTAEFKNEMDNFNAFGNRLLKGVQHQIGKAPAIIFNDQYVIYGEPSLSRAVKTYWAEVGTQ